MTLHTPTLIVVGVLMASILCVAHFLTWRVNRPVTALRYWAIADALFALGLLLFLARAPMPAPPVVLAGNAALSGGFVALWYAIRGFLGEPPLHTPAWVLFVAHLSVLAVFLLVEPSAVAARAVTVLLYVALMSTLCAADLLRAARGSPATPVGGLGYIFLGHGLFCLLRAGATMVTGEEIASVLSSDTLQTLTFLEGAAAMVALGVGALVMTTHHLQDELRRSATYDALTRAYNRGTFLELAEREFARYRRTNIPFTLLLVDIDHFKRINDSFGHQAGDSVLRGFADRIAGLLRQGDLFGRYGGEEFCVLLPATDRAGALIVAERLRAEQSEHVVEYEGNLIATTISIGVAESTAAATFDAVLAEADAALYRAKSTGRDRVVACRAA